MRRSQQVAIAVSIVTVAGLAALAAPAIGSAASTVSGWALSAPASAAPTDTPSTIESVTPSPVPVEVDPLDGCQNPAEIRIGRMDAGVSGVVEDRGARPYAEGEVGVDEDGTIVSYTVADGDGFFMIGERLCLKNPMLLDQLNHSRDIYPGQVLRLSQDPRVPNVPFFNPPDVGEGFLQIPYQQAIVEMRKAANAGDVDRMRRIWADTLAPMFPVQADVDLISAFMDAGDIDALRQMFA